ncbi:MAG: YlbF family regulator, partial [Firmicutes bacterium]|nr:YlbF family regulator [Bacillota bacterium]
VQAFQDHQKAFDEKQQQGEKITPEQMDQLRLQQQQMLDNPEISAYLNARDKVNGLLEAVNATIARVTGMETGHSHDGCCGGDCDCSGDCC